MASYDLRVVGKGAVAAAAREWEDPYFLAADVHSLVSRRYDPVRLFNGGSLWLHYSTAPQDHAALLQLVSFTTRPSNSVSLIPAVQWKSALMHTLASDSAAQLEPEKVEGRMEFHLPAFSNYAALEFRS